MRRNQRRRPQNLSYIRGMFTIRFVWRAIKLCISGVATSENGSPRRWPKVWYGFVQKTKIRQRYHQVRSFNHYRYTLVSHSKLLSTVSIFNNSITVLNIGFAKWYKFVLFVREREKKATFEISEVLTSSGEIQTNSTTQNCAPKIRRKSCNTR